MTYSCTVVVLIPYRGQRYRATVYVTTCCLDGAKNFVAVHILLLQYEATCINY